MPFAYGTTNNGWGIICSGNGSGGSSDGNAMGDGLVAHTQYERMKMELKIVEKAVKRNELPLLVGCLESDEAKSRLEELLKD